MDHVPFDLQQSFTKCTHFIARRQMFLSVTFKTKEVEIAGVVAFVSIQPLIL